MGAFAANAGKEYCKTIATNVTHRLRPHIIALHLKTDEPLNSDALRRSYDANFSALREALTALVDHAVVAAEKQRCFRIAPVSLEDLLDLAHERLLVEKETLRLPIQNDKNE
jgi:GntR family carbon starvation induced transcriptional regulator